MKAVVVAPDSRLDGLRTLLNIDMPIPEPEPRDLLVKISAVAVNPCDLKMRTADDPTPRVLGFDAAGVIEAVGEEVEGFRPGDQVFYMGDISRQGCNSEYHIVDERLVGRKPHSIGFAEAAALPLTAITAWELLIERMGLPSEPASEHRLLVIGGSGGVGSMILQWARSLSKVEIVATAGTELGRDWCRGFGAHHVVDHHHSLVDQIRPIGIESFEYIVSTANTVAHWTDIVELLAPRGHLGVVDDAQITDMLAIKPGCASFHWSAAFSRPRLKLADQHIHGQVLNLLADLIDAGAVASTLHTHFGSINAANVTNAHTWISAGHAIGKGVLEGFGA